MTADGESQSQRVSEGLRKVLDRHGYGFQYAVLRRGQELSEAKKSAWLFEVAEFPVEVRGSGTRIDFVLTHRSGPWQIIAECKRVDPALARWAFAKAPYVRRNRSDEPYFAERVCKESSGFSVTGVRLDRRFDNAYQVALELKTDQSGDGTSSGRSAIEEAASQVCRGVGGMVEFLFTNHHLLTESKPIVLLPVIFTTAELWTTNADLSESDCATGKLPSEVKVEKADWVCLQYHVSPGLKHSHRPPTIGGTLGAILDTEYVRTIAIVNASGIDRFLRAFDDF